MARRLRRLPCRTCPSPEIGLQFASCEQALAFRQLDLLDARESLERSGYRLRAVSVVAQGCGGIEHRLHHRESGQREMPVARGLADQAQIFADELDKETGAPVTRNNLRTKIGQLP